jgi:S-adenosylmethionine-diacylglycerol 3-amino-3-carboxypropyl transferase
MTNNFLERAVHTRPALSKRGLLERLFTLMFKELIYCQVWEDSEIDLAALSLRPHHTLITIASAGCNVLNYLADNPARIVAVDLNPNQVALTRLKLTALRHLPSYEEFFRFFGCANSKANLQVYDTQLSSWLDSETRSYWGKGIPLKGRRINMFSRNLYRYGVVGRFIGLMHMITRLQGNRLEDIIEARDQAEQRAAFDRIIAPFFDRKIVKLLSRTPLFLYGLGVPPAQYDELVAECNGNLGSILRERLEKLACGFPVSTNYFAWQVFARSYDVKERKAVPAYLRQETYELIRTRIDRVEIHRASIIDFLKDQPPQSINRFVLLDAQDWMTTASITELWQEIGRVAESNDARVIFRTAGNSSPLPRKLPNHLLEPWHYLEEESRRLHEKDRSSIFGGFHIYLRKPMSET